MKLILVFLPVLLSAQTVTLTLTGPVSAKQGSTVNLTLSSSGATVSGPAGLQWTVSPPAGSTVGTPTAGTATTAASKQVACGAANLLCLVYGLNQNVIANGAVATIPVTIANNAATGAAVFTLTGIFAPDKTGAVMATAAGPPLSVTIISMADLNGDGTVTLADVQLMLTQSLGGAPCTSDQNGDGKCDIYDVYNVVLRALGL